MEERTVLEVLAFKGEKHQNVSRSNRVSTYGKKVKQSAPLEAWSGPEVSRKFRFPDFMTTAQDDGKCVSLTHRPPLPPGNTPSTHFC
jgi:hypothetical protein